MSSIKPCKNGYRAQVYVQGQRDSATFRLKREAEAWAFKREEELRKGQGTEGHTLRDALDRYVKEIAPGKNGERWEVLRINAFLRDKTIPTHAAMRTIRPDAFDDWRDSRLKTVSPGTVRREINLLSRLLQNKPQIKATCCFINCDI
jgi:hypothetical protein